MPRIPSYRQQQLPSTNIGAAPLPVSAANINAGVIGKGLSAVGKGIGDIGEFLFKIEQDKQQIRDEAALADALSQDNNWEFQKQQEFRDKVYTNIGQINEDRKNVANEYDSFKNTRIAGMGKKAAAEYVNRSTMNRASSLRSLEGELYKNEVRLGQETASRNLGQQWNIFYSTEDRATQERALDTMKLLQKGTAKYFAPGQLEELNAKSEITVLKSLNRFDEAQEKLDSSIYYDAMQKEAETHNIESAKKRFELQLEKKGYDGEVATYDNFIQKLVFPKSETDELKLDDIEGSTLKDNPKGQKDPSLSKPKWRRWFDAINTKKQSISTIKGTDGLINVILNSNNGKKNTRDSYDALIELYATKKITKEELAYGYTKVNKLYPKEVFTNLSATILANRNDFHGWWNSGEEIDIANYTNKALLGWVDKQITEKKTPDAMEMAKMSSQFRTNAQSLVSQYGTTDITFTEKKYRIGDTKIIKGETYTFDGMMWKTK